MHFPSFGIKLVFQTIEYIEPKTLKHSRKLDIIKLILLAKNIGKSSFVQAKWIGLDGVPHGLWARAEGTRYVLQTMVAMGSTRERAHWCEVMCLVKWCRSRKVSKQMLHLRTGWLGWSRLAFFPSIFASSSPFKPLPSTSSLRTLFLWCDLMW